MAFEFPIDSVDPDNLDGFNPVAAGLYHVEINSVDENSGKNDDTMVVDFEILAGTTANQEGKTYRDYFGKDTEGQLKRALILAVASGLLSPDELKQHKDAGTNPSVDFETLAPGRQLCIGLEDETWEGKTRAKMGFKMFAIDSEPAGDIPMNKGKLAQLGNVTTATAAPAAAAAPGSEDAFDNVF